MLILDLNIAKQMNSRVFRAGLIQIAAISPPIHLDDTFACQFLKPNWDFRAKGFTTKPQEKLNKKKNYTEKTLFKKNYVLFYPCLCVVSKRNDVRA